MKYYRILFSFIFVYVFFGFFIYFSQSSFIYFPSNQDFFDCSGFQGFDRVSYKDTNFYFLNKSEQRVLVFYHGNAGSVCDRSPIANFFYDKDISLIFVEYAGYGDSSISPSKDLILGNVLDVGSFTDSFSEVFVLGASIGSGPASFQAFSFDNVNKVFLVNPFDSLKSVARESFFFYPVGFMLRENYDNVFWLEGFDGEVHIFHGEDDVTISPSHSYNLYNSLRDVNVSYILIEGASHNDIWSFFEFTDNLRSFI
ncbi:MAG: alpha/beta hydrolase [Candidatus Woesearchaeota archaeon]